MMDGYSVTEAASVLGVPTERVWELLARGVLAGRPEGESGMRVFLQPRAQVAPAPARDDPPPGNGSERGELSPFRELLTEFRNLTERYGQALLALGEARGEVASLRSRVDLLEARMELRLPMAAGPAPTSWPLPSGSADVSPPPTVPDQDVAEADDEEAHRARRRGPRRATESFAEALGRAEDARIPDLLAETDAAADAAAAATVEAPPPALSEPSLPREVAPADPVLVADETVGAADDAPASVAVVEASPEVDVPTAEVDIDADAPEAGALDAMAPETSEPDVAEPEPAAAEVAEDQPSEADAIEPEPAAEGEFEPAPERAADAPAAAETEASPEAAPDEPAAPAPEEAAVATAEAGPIDYDEGRYTTEIDEPDWFAAEVEEGVAFEQRSEEPPPDGGGATQDAAPGVIEDGIETQLARDEAAEAASEPVAASDVDAEAPETEPEPEPAADPPSDARVDEETMLWFGRRDEAAGADEMEVVGPSLGSTPGSEDPSASLPGSDELDRALAALAEGSGSDAAGRTADEEWPPPPSLESPTPATDRPAVPSVADAIRHRPIMPSGPATRAYRRLRRIFPE